jgi:hypothetical protein
MTKALADINSGKCYVRRAAEDYCIPKSTIYDRLSGKVVPGSVCGAHRYLTESKENELEAFLLGCSEIGFGKTRSEVLRIVERVLRQRGVNQSVSNGWWESFLKRHPILSLRTPACLSRARALASDDQLIDQYFSILEQALTENKLTDKPFQIFNMDETGVPLDPKPAKIVSQRGSKHPIAASSGRKEQITVVACTNAGGYYLPPMIIWKTKTLSPPKEKFLALYMHLHLKGGWIKNFLIYGLKNYSLGMHQVLGLYYYYLMDIHHTTALQLYI